jgi:hypothetical protein
MFERAKRFAIVLSALLIFAGTARRLKRSSSLTQHLRPKSNGEQQQSPTR